MDSSNSSNLSNHSHSPWLVLSRASQLAQVQANQVRDKLKALGLATKLVTEVSPGDKALASPLHELGSTGVFVKHLQAALLEKKARLAVHSYKDLPSLAPKGLARFLLKRENPFDAWVSAFSWQAFPKGGRIGTASLRRAHAMLSLRPDCQIVLVRGNLQRRLSLLDEGKVQALVLASAGLERLGLQARIQASLQDKLLPAAGQGVLAVEVREEDEEAKAYMQALQDKATLWGGHAERSAVLALGGGCHSPLSAFADFPKPFCLRLRLHWWGAPGQPHFQTEAQTDLIQSETGSEINNLQAAFELGQKAAQDLVKQGLESHLQSAFDSPFVQ